MSAENQNKLEDAVVDAVNLLETEARDSTINSFIIDGLLAHCEDEDHLQQFLAGMIVNLSINKLMCPYCFAIKLGKVVDDNFEYVPTKEGHDVKFKHAGELTEAIIDGETVQ